MHLHESDQMAGFNSRMLMTWNCFGLELVRGKGITMQGPAARQRSQETSVCRGS